MDRRLFLRSGSVASLGLTTGFNLFDKAAPTIDLKQNQVQDNFELDEITIDELQQKMIDTFWKYRLAISLKPRARNREKKICTTFVFRLRKKK